MRITINGEIKLFDEKTTVGSMLDRLQLDASKVAVERNREIVSLPKFDNTELQHNDVIEIIHFIGGG